ncbi:MAG: pyruvate, phosphate dikinase, partial [SAR202 cluster bacterium]|nr:pyruvate, phosphate dikinase [SAR202 cluster bacterium]
MLMRYIYSFDEAEDLHPLEIGGKGFGLARLVREGFRVPPGFIITTEACKYVLEHQSTPDTLIAEVNRNMGYLEEACARSFGSSKNPLVVSVRSGAPVSMPGMMDTLLNLGICRQAIKGLCEETEDVPFVVDLVLRFHRMFLEIVEGIEYSKINECIEGLIPHGAIGPTPSYELIDDFFTDLESREREVLGCVVPDDVQVQLERAVGAVFQSWNSRRAKAYRKHNNISHDMGTAVVIQEMVFGNRGDTSGSGVVFSRNPSIGNREIYGEFIFNGQGEDVVSGTHTPMTLEDAAKDIPDVVNELCEAVEKLERIYENVVDVEFTVEDRVLYLLQVRPAKLTASAAVKICSDFIDEGWTDPATAMELLTVEHIRELSRPRFDVAEVEKLRAEEQLLTTGLGASVGQSSGVIVTDPDRAERFVSKDQSVVLIRRTTSPLDLHGMLGAAAIVTATGGATSHAAVVARSIGTPCVVGCAQLEIFEDDDSIEINGRRIEPNTVVSVDGQTGEIFLGNIPT